MGLPCCNNVQEEEEGTGSGCSHACRQAGWSARISRALAPTAKHFVGRRWYFSPFFFFFFFFFPLFFFTWPDRSYLNQPRSESDVSPNTALRSPSCASSDRRGAKQKKEKKKRKEKKNPSPKRCPFLPALSGIKYFFFFFFFSLHR